MSESFGGRKELVCTPSGGAKSAEAAPRGRLRGYLKFVMGAGSALQEACCCRYVAVGQDRWCGQGDGGVCLCGVQRPFKRVVVAAHVLDLAGARWRYGGGVGQCPAVRQAQNGFIGTAQRHMQHGRAFRAQLDLDALVVAGGQKCHVVGLFIGKDIAALLAVDAHWQ